MCRRLQAAILHRTHDSDTTTIHSSRPPPQPRQINMLSLCFLLVSVPLDIMIGHVFQTSLSQNLRRSLGGLRLLYRVTQFLFKNEGFYGSWTWDHFIAQKFFYSGKVFVNLLNRSSCCFFKELFTDSFLGSL